jgi:hypothetical protein
VTSWIGKRQTPASHRQVSILKHAYGWPALKASKSQSSLNPQQMQLSASRGAND